MAYHPGLQLATITVGGASTLESGESLVLSAHITASRSLLWVDGDISWHYDSDTKTVDGTLGSELLIELLPCDIQGFRTQNNQIIDVSVPGSYTHLYNIRVTKSKMVGNKKVQVGTSKDYSNVFIPTGDGSPVDLDTMQPVATVAGGVVLVPDTWDKRVAAAEAAAVAAEAVVPTTDAAVRAAFETTGSASDAYLAGKIASNVAPVRRIASPGGGAVCISIDDAFSAMRTFATLLNERGQRATFCITTNLMNDATGATKIIDQDILDFHAAGHEIAAHSKTHANLTSITPAQAVTELEYPKLWLEGLIGSPVTTWAYTFGTSSGGRNATTDSYVYPLYDRVLDTNVYRNNSIWPRWTEPPALIQRTAWIDTNQEQALAMVKKAADSPVVSSLFFHNIGTAVNPTMAQVVELLDYALALGVPLLTVREAFGGFHYLTNPSFEDGFSGWRKIIVGGGALEVVAAPPDAGVTGTKVLRITAPDSTGGAYVAQQVPVQPGRTYRASGRGRVVSGVIRQQNDNYIRVRFRRVDGSEISYVRSAAVTASAWTKFGFDVTAPPDAAYVHFEVVCADVEGGCVMEFDHMFFGPQTQFDLG